MSLYGGWIYLHHVVVVTSAVSFTGLFGATGVRYSLRFVGALGSRRGLLGSGGIHVKRSLRIVHCGIVRGHLLIE